MPRKDAAGGSISAQAQQDIGSEGIEQYELPKSLVTRIAKSALPENVKMQRETVLSLVKGSTVFINYLAATAHDVALSKQHKSISASDVLKALETIEFGDLVDKLQNELVVYRELAKTDKSKRGSVSIGPSVGGKGKGPAVASASVASTPGGASAGASISAVTGKGKERATIVLPARASASATPAHAESASAAAMDVDRDEDEADVDVDVDPDMRGGATDDEERVNGDLDEEVEEDVDGGVGDERDEEEEQEEPEELVDTAALDDEEMQRDARGLDGGGGHTVADMEE